MLRNEPPLLVSLLGPGIRIKQINALKTLIRQRLQKRPCITMVNAQVLNGRFLDMGQKLGYAIEQGLPLVRAANTGISAVIDPVGRVIASSQLGEETVLDARLPDASQETAFSRCGMLPCLLLMILVGCLLAQGTKKSFRA